MTFGTSNGNSAAFTDLVSQVAELKGLRAPQATEALRQLADGRVPAGKATSRVAATVVMALAEDRGLDVVAQAHRSGVYANATDDDSLALVQQLAERVSAALDINVTAQLGTYKRALEPGDLG